MSTSIEAVLERNVFSTRKCSGYNQVNMFQISRKHCKLNERNDTVKPIYHQLCYCYLIIVILQDILYAYGICIRWETETMTLVLHALLFELHS